MNVIGIDPGLTGALALINKHGLQRCESMPIMAKGKGASKIKNEVNGAELAELLRAWVNGHTIVVVELTNSRPTSGPPQPCPACKRDTKALGSATVYSMGDTNGVVRGVLAAYGALVANVSVELVTPRSWKARYGLDSDKERARATAIRLYPAAPLGHKKDHNLAEAILIAKYGWDMFGPRTGEPF